MYKPTIILHKVFSQKTLILITLINFRFRCVSSHKAISEKSAKKTSLNHCRESDWWTVSAGISLIAQKFSKTRETIECESISITWQNSNSRKFKHSLTKYVPTWNTSFASNSRIRAGRNDLSLLLQRYYYPTSEGLLRNIVDPNWKKNFRSIRILGLGLLLDPWMEWQNSFLPLMPKANWNLQKWQIENQNLSRNI